ncbi:MAG: response regulator [Desulfobacteraceae bacterium]|nr:response regulator [Desulfobacteraceae bacterium]
MKQSEETIFVVDDDQGILDSFDAVFGDDYPLVLLDSGVKALKILAEENPKLLFLDIKMPGINGLEILQRMREANSPTQVVIVTALPQDKYEEIARRYGVYRYLKKPFDLDEVESIAKTILLH